MKIVPCLYGTPPSQQKIVKQDMRFFRRNPGVKQYTRKATKTEREDLGLPPGTLVTVIKSGKWHHHRLFRVPNEGQN